MAAAGIGNPAGAVQVFDFGAPKLIGANVRNEIVSGGVFVFGSTANGVVSSGTNAFSPGSVLISRDASGGKFNGINMFTTAVSGAATVALGGVFILQCAGSVIGGFPVMCDGNNSVHTLGSRVVPDAATNWGPAACKIGRALTDGASGGYALVHINP